MPHRRPARFERTRCTAYRCLMRGLWPLRWVALILPRNHPYRTFFLSTVDELRELSKSTAVARAPRMTRAQWVRSPAMKVALCWVVLLLGSDTLAASPVDLGLLPDVRIGIRQALHLGPGPKGPRVGPMSLPWHTTTLGEKEWAPW